MGFQSPEPDYFSAPPAADASRRRRERARADSVPKTKFIQRCAHGQKSGRVQTARGTRAQISIRRGKPVSPRRTATASQRRWSQEVTEHSDALTLEGGVFTSKDPRRIAPR
jgi:hypothetical protein